MISRVFSTKTWENIWNRNNIKWNWLFRTNSMTSKEILGSPMKSSKLKICLKSNKKIVSLLRNREIFKYNWWKKQNNHQRMTEISSKLSANMTWNGIEMKSLRKTQRERTKYGKQTTKSELKVANIVLTNPVPFWFIKLKICI